MQSSYITSAQLAEQLPKLDAPEVAFVGRSNCGKSSLLNALLGRTGLARTSNTPGRTQMVNFFAVDRGEERTIFADLPGYGYSAIGKESRRAWQGLVDAYLKRRELRELLFLIDIRRAETMEEEDLALLTSLCSRRPDVTLTLVLTKLDKVNRSEADKTKAKVLQQLELAGVTAVRVAPVSSLKGTGIEPLRKALLGE